MALLAHTPAPTDAQIRAALAPHLCRCGVYPRAINQHAAHATPGVLVVVVDAISSACSSSAMRRRSPPCR